VSGITTHVLDVSIGRPAAGVTVALDRQMEAGEWVNIGTQTTDVDGRARELTTDALELPEGTYRLTFDVGSYFGGKGTESFYQNVVIAFSVRDASQHYHVPLLLSPFGYSTYRGS
jgi:5-hydroxyisourate hydrolase